MFLARSGGLVAGAARIGAGRLASALLSAPDATCSFPFNGVWQSGPVTSYEILSRPFDISERGGSRPREIICLGSARLRNAAQSSQATPNAFEKGGEGGSALRAKGG